MTTFISAIPRYELFDPERFVYKIEPPVRSPAGCNALSARSAQGLAFALGQWWVVHGGNFPWWGWWPFALQTRTWFSCFITPLFPVIPPVYSQSYKPNSSAPETPAQYRAGVVRRWPGTEPASPARCSLTGQRNQFCTLWLRVLRAELWLSAVFSVDVLVPGDVVAQLRCLLNLGPIGQSFHRFHWSLGMENYVYSYRK